MKFPPRNSSLRGQDNTADFAPALGTVNFPAGVGAASVTVALASDAVAETNETLAVRLLSATGATIADGEAAGRLCSTPYRPITTWSPPPE